MSSFKEYKDNLFEELVLKWKSRSNQIHLNSNKTRLRRKSSLIIGDSLRLLNPKGNITQLDVFVKIADMHLSIRESFELSLVSKKFFSKLFYHLRDKTLRTSKGLTQNERRELWLSIIPARIKNEKMRDMEEDKNNSTHMTISVDSKRTFPTLSSANFSQQVVKNHFSASQINPPESPRRLQRVLAVLPRS